jgi:hypothetical protein
MLLGGRPDIGLFYLAFTMIALAGQVLAGRSLSRS